MVVGGIKNLIYSLCDRLCAARLYVFALAEHMDIEILRSLRVPESYTVYRLGVVAGNIHIVRHGVDDGAIAVIYNELAVFPGLVHVTAEFNGINLLLTGSKPHVAHFKPVVRLLELPAVNDDLLEKTVIVKNGKSACRIAEGRKRVHIRGGESAETAVAESRVGLVGINFVQGNAEAFDCFPDGSLYAHIEKVVAKRPAKQKFHRHIVNLLCIFLVYLFFKVDARLSKNISHAHTGCSVNLSFACVLGLNAEISCQTRCKLSTEFLRRYVKFHFPSFLPLSPGRKT